MDADARPVFQGRKRDEVPAVARQVQHRQHGCDRYQQQRRELPLRLAEAGEQDAAQEQQRQDEHRKIVCPYRRGNDEHRNGRQHEQAAALHGWVLGQGHALLASKRVRQKE